MRVLIAGSRSIRDFTLLERVVEESEFQITGITCGCAGGVDWMAGHDTSGIRKRPQDCDGGLAMALGINPVHFPVKNGDIERYGAYGADGAFCRRDRAMVLASDAAIFLWDGRSNGTGYTVQYAKQVAVPYVLWNNLTGQLGRSEHGPESR
jgi:hypothetical protein